MEKNTSISRVPPDSPEVKSQTIEGPARSHQDMPDSPALMDEHVIEQQSRRLLQKKNQLHPLFVNHPYRCGSMYGPRAASSQPKMKNVSQRIVSAKLLQIKELRNQLTLTQQQLNKVTNENRVLETLQKRQEVALRKYEGQEARLPQLIQSHNEEVRILTSKLKQVKHSNMRLVDKLKTAEQQLSVLQEQHCHLVTLSHNQQLGEREALANQVSELQHCVRQQNNTIQLLNRKVDLERKNYKHELSIEKSKRNEVERKLSLAMQTIENLKDQIEAKEKCLNAMVPSRFIRTSHPLTQPINRLTHCQMPRTPLAQNNVQAYKNTGLQTSERSSADEIDVPDFRSENNTSDTSGTTLPKIKPQTSNKTMRNQYKLSSKRMINNDRSSTHDTPDYSSSFTSEDISLGDLRKTSGSELEKVCQATQKSVSSNSEKNSGRGRQFSVDSGVMNKSESGKATQRTDQSRASSTKTRRNSISVCPEELENQGQRKQHLQQDSLLSKEVTKSIREELKELEERLLQGSSFLDQSKTGVHNDVHNEIQEPDKDIEKDNNETPRNLSEDESNEDSRENLDDITWDEIHNKIKAESDAAEAKLEEYYNTLEKSELSLEDTENCIALEEEQKEKLLKALREIDNEVHGVNSSSSGEETIHKPARRKSDSYKYNFSKNVENLYRGRPVYDKVKVPVIEKMKKEEKECMSDIENGRKKKSDFFKDLFCDFDNTSHRNTHTESRTHNLERMVQLNRSFD